MTEIVDPRLKSSILSLMPIEPRHETMTAMESAGVQLLPPWAIFLIYCLFYGRAEVTPH